MIILYYKDKDIIFETKNNTYITKDCIFSDEPTLELVLKELEGRDSITIISNDKKKSYDYFCTFFTLVQAGGGVVRNPHGGVLMIYRNGMWDLPKGHLEEGECIQQCAVREVEEETGVVVRQVKDEYITTQHFYSLDGVWRMKTTYWYAMLSDSEEFVPQECEGITSCQWLDGHGLQEAYVGSYRAVQYVLNETGMF